MKNTRPKARTPLKNALFLLSALFFLYGIAVVWIIGVGHWFNFVPLIIAAGLALLGLLVPFFATHPLPRRILIALLALALLHGAVFEAKLIREAKEPPAENAKWVLVLGAKVNGETPSLTLRNRSVLAASYLSENADAICITTGGQGPDEGIPEAVAAKRVIARAGIPESQILLEDQSTSTRENLAYALRLIRESGGSPDDSVVIVTSRFHIYRAKKLAASLGFTSVSALGSDDLPLLVPHYYFREYAANLLESLNGHF